MNHMRSTQLHVNKDTSALSVKKKKVNIERLLHDIERLLTNF